MMQLDDYLARLELSNVETANTSLLHRLHERHLLKVPFENLDIRAGIPILLDENRILEKIVTHRRGGICYELNIAFAWLLRELGFNVEILAADVHTDQGKPSGRPTDHLVLRVELAEPWICDVGFGDAFLYPLKMDDSKPVKQLVGTFRVVDEGDQGRAVQRFEREIGEFRTLYSFEPTPRSIEDFEDACRYHQTSDESKFTQRSVCTMAIPDGRIVIYEDRVVIRRRGREEVQPLPTPESREAALRRHFGIVL